MTNDDTNCPNAQAAIDAGERIDKYYELGCDFGDHITSLIKFELDKLPEDVRKSFAEGVDDSIYIPR